MPGTLVAVESEKALVYALRRAEAGDARRIRELVRKERLNPTGLDWRRFIVAADSEHGVIGCGQIKPIAADAKELASLVVDSEWRDRGVGSALIQQLMAEAGPPLWLMCRSGLAPYYQRFGFRSVPRDGRQPRYFLRIRRLADVLRAIVGQGESLTVMTWEAAG